MFHARFSPWQQSAARGKMAACTDARTKRNVSAKWHLLLNSSERDNPQTAAESQIRPQYPEYEDTDFSNLICQQQLHSASYMANYSRWCFDLHCLFQTLDGAVPRFAHTVKCAATVLFISIFETTPPYLIFSLCFNLRNVIYVCAKRRRD